MTRTRCAYGAAVAVAATLGLLAAQSLWVTVPPEEYAPQPAESGLVLPLGGER